MSFRAAMLALALQQGLATNASAARHAVVIGNNLGLHSEVRLSFAEEDSKRFHDALLDVGAVSPSRAWLLSGQDIASIERALLEAGDSVAVNDTLIVFFSGHGSARGAHINGEVWPWPRIRGFLSGTRARVSIGIFDACQSGAVLHPKGFLRGPAIRVSAQPVGPEGHVLIASSGANEISHESTLLGGSPFTHFIVSGLRGTADQNRDGRITLAELYADVLGRTMAATLQASTGPQRPARALELRGAGEIVLSELGAQFARVFQTRSELGACYLLDGADTTVLAQLSLSSGTPVAVHPGEYLVKCLAHGHLRYARAELCAGDTSIDDLVFETTSLTPTLAKGPAGNAAVGLGVDIGVHRSSAPTAGAVVGLHFWHDTRTGFWEARATGATGGGEAHRFGGSIGLGFRLPWWQIPSSTLYVGLLAGASWLRSEGDWKPSVGIGQFGHIEWAVASANVVFARVDLVTRYPLETTKGLSFGTILTVGWRHNLGQ